MLPKRRLPAAVMLLLQLTPLAASNRPPRLRAAALPPPPDPFASSQRRRVLQIGVAESHTPLQPSNAEAQTWAIWEGGVDRRDDAALRHLRGGVSTPAAPVGDTFASSDSFFASVVASAPPLQPLSTPLAVEGAGLSHAAGADVVSAIIPAVVGAPAAPATDTGTIGGPLLVAIGATSTYDECVEICAALSPARKLCAYNEYCPNGIGAPPAFGAVGSDTWAPVARGDGITNDWVQLADLRTEEGGNLLLCQTHSAVWGFPEWGTVAEARTWRSQAYCCTPPTGVAWGSATSFTRLVPGLDRLVAGVTFAGDAPAATSSSPPTYAVEGAGLSRTVGADVASLNSLLTTIASDAPAAAAAAAGLVPAAAAGHAAPPLIAERRFDVAPAREIVRDDRVESTLRAQVKTERAQLKRNMNMQAFEELEAIELRSVVEASSGADRIVLLAAQETTAEKEETLQENEWQLENKLAQHEFDAEKREAILELRHFESTDVNDPATEAKERDLMRQLKLDNGQTVEGETLLTEVRDFLARDEVRELRRTLELIRIKKESGATAEVMGALRMERKAEVEEAVTLMSHAASSRAWSSGGVSTTLDVVKQKFDDGAVGQRAAARDNLLDAHPLKEVLYSKTRGSRPSSPSQAVRVEPWWVPGQCAALAASPPAAILALRDAHALALGGRGIGMMTAEMLSGASTNNRREMTELGFVVAYLTGRSFLLDEELNSDFWVYDRADFEIAVPILDGNAVAKGAAKYGTNGRATRGLPVKGLGGVTRKEGMKSMNLKQWISELMRPEYTAAPLLTTHLQWGSPTFILQLDRTIMGESRADLEAVAVLEHIEGVLRHCLHVNDEVMTHFMKLRALLPPTYYAVNVRHKKIEVVARGTIDVPLFDCSKLASAGWAMRQITVTQPDEVALQQIMVPCETGVGSQHAPLTVGDAIALLDAAPGALVYIASWHRETAVEKTIRALGFVPTSYDDLMPKYVEKYNSLPEIKFFRYVMMDELFLAYATQYIADWPSSVTEAVVSMQRWIDEMQHPMSSNVFRGTENWRVFVNVTRVNKGFN